MALTVFCDFDGPIVDVSERYYRTYCTCLERACDAPQRLPKAEFWRLKRDRVPDAEIARRSGVRAQELAQFVREVQHTAHQPQLLALDRLQPGADRALQRLADREVRTVIVTLREVTQVAAVLEQFGLADAIAALYGTDDRVAAYRNNVERKQFLLARALTDQSEPVAYVIGDTEADLLAARALGIPSIALACGIRSPSYLLRYQPQRLQPDLACAAAYLLEQTVSALSSR